MTHFSDLGLCEPILKAIEEQGYSSPTPIQQQAIPAVLNGKDLMAAAQTGTGKTAAFTLPMLHQLANGEKAKSNQVRALVLAPTRELAQQVHDNIQTYSKYLKLTSAVVYGGVKINPQMMKLRKGVDILVACPGRLLDLYSQNAIRFHHTEFLVLDEADRMLDMGFIEDIERIIELLPKQRRSLMFSATFSGKIRALAKDLVQDPFAIDISPRNSTAHNVTQWVIPIDKKRKADALIELLNINQWHQVLVFARTKHGCEQLAKKLKSQGINADAIHGDKSQAVRNRVLTRFKQNKTNVLVATDVAARGIDIDQLPHVINYELPHTPSDYVHRIGRTGRAGAKGDALSMVSADEYKNLAGIEELIGKPIQREYIEGFEPDHDLPAIGSKVNNKKSRTRPKKGQRTGTNNKQGYQTRKRGEEKPVASRRKRNDSRSDNRDNRSSRSKDSHSDTRDNRSSRSKDSHSDTRDNRSSRSKDSRSDTRDNRSSRSKDSRSDTRDNRSSRSKDSRSDTRDNRSSRSSRNNKNDDGFASPKRKTARKAIKGTLSSNSEGKRASSNQRSKKATSKITRNKARSY